MVSCAGNVGPSEITPPDQPPIDNALTPHETYTLIPVPTLGVLVEAKWNIYDSSPQHLWNRLFRQLYRRTTRDGREYGWDSLDPPLWPDTTYLLEGNSYQQAIQLLDEYLSTKGEALITDPLQRAIFQRDLWAVFDWLTLQSNYSARSQQLQWRLAQVMRKVALSEQEILSLPDNYKAAIESKAFPAKYHGETPDIGFLPADLFLPDGEWVCLGREGGPIAMTHTEEFPFFGRSAFLVFMRVPGGREATLKFLHDLNTEDSPILPVDTEVALVRRAMMINDQGIIIPSPTVESVQIRHLCCDNIMQSLYEFNLNRAFLMAEVMGGLQPVHEEMLLFLSQGDPFQMDSSVVKVQIPNICTGCHFGNGLTESILSYYRYTFPLPEQRQPHLIETTPEIEAQTVIAWKQEHHTWLPLTALWRQGNP